MSTFALACAVSALLLCAVALAALAALRGWRGWLELKHLELTRPAGPAAWRNELAGLRERVRRLEAIVDGRG